MIARKRATQEERSTRRGFGENLRDKGEGTAVADQPLPRPHPYHSFRHRSKFAGNNLWFSKSKYIGDKFV